MKLGELTGRLRAATPSRRKLVSGAVLGVGVLGVLVAILLSDGFRATTLDLSDSGVWVTRSVDARVGRINAQIQAQDAISKKLGDAVGAGLDVVQDGRDVFVVNTAQGSVARVDPARPAADLKFGQGVPNSRASLGAGRMVLVDAEGRAWVSRVSDSAPVSTAGLKPTWQLGAGGDALVDRSGRVLAYSARTGEVIVRPVAAQGSQGPGDEKVATGLPAGARAGEVQLSAVGDRAVALDTRSRKVWVEGGDTVDLPDEVGQGPVLQLPGDPAGHVLVGGSAGLFRVPLAGGAVEKVREWDGAASGVRPAHVDGCDYGVGGARPVFVVRCGDRAVARYLDELRGTTGSAGTTRAVQFQNGPLQLRVNRRNVVLNQLGNGQAVTVTRSGRFRVVDDWESLQPSDESEEPTEDQQRPQVLDLTAQNRPPEPEDDRFGARQGVATPLGVLDNDVDPDGDALVVEVVDGSVSPQGTPVGVVDNGQRVLVTPQSGSGTVSFRYRVTDGRGGADEASVTVEIKSKDQNTAPHPKIDWRRAPFWVEATRTGTYDALANYVDDEGDPMVLASATAPAPDVAVADPAGTLTFTSNSAVASTVTVQLQVRDVPPGPASLSTDDPQVVEVLARGDQRPPQPAPDYASTVEGQATVVQPLANDTDPNGDPLRVVEVVPTDWGGRPAPTVTLNSDGTVRFQPAAAGSAGSYVFGYKVTDGFTEPAVGLVRVDVRPAGNRPPTAGRDLVVLPVALSNSRTVDLLANDVDPDGDVLVVQSVEQQPGLGIELLDRRRLRVSAPGELRVPVTLRYLVSDGTAQVEGQVVVTSQRVDESSLSLIARPDTVSVRAGDLVTIPVLSNDLDPLGGDLYLRPTFPVPPAEGQGTAWVSGRAVRFLAPDRPGRVELTYGISRSAESPAEEASALVTINVVAPSTTNQAPVPRTVEARVLVGGTVRIPIPLGGIDPDGDSVSLVGLSLGGDTPLTPRLGRPVTPVGPDYLNYEAFPAPTGGTDVFAYEVRDSRGQTAVGVIRVGVVPRSGQNQKPVAVADRVLVRPGGSARSAILANDYDPDDDPIALDRSSFALPAGLEGELDDRGRLQVRAPGGPVGPVSYRISDPSGASADGRVDVVVTPDAPGQAPVARDDEPRNVPGDAQEVAVDVLANDEDPDGDVGALALAPVAGSEGVTVRDRTLVVRLDTVPRLVPYTVTDGDGLTATAVVRVPPRGGVNRPPEARIPQEVREVKEDETLEVKLADVVTDPEGQPVRLTLADRVAAVNSDGSPLVRKDRFDSVFFTPKPGYSGSASVTFEVTDGADATDPKGARAVITVPVKVRATANQPPVWRNAPVVEVAPKEAEQRVRLSALVDDPEGDRLQFTVGAVDGAGVEVRKDGDDLVARVTDDRAQPGERTVAVEVTDGTSGPVPTTAVVRVVGSTKPAPTCTPVLLGDATAGREISFDVTQSCTNPFPDAALQLSGASGPAPVEKEGTTVRFTPPKGTVGDFTVAFDVTDAVGRSANGSVTARIRDVPGKPNPPDVVSVASRTVTLSWQKPADNGAPIDYYEVAWSGGRQRCESTSCVIDNLQNDVEYRFTVLAHNAVDDGPASDPSGPARPDQRPEAPTTVTLGFDPARNDPKVGGQLVVEWAASRTEGSAVTGYRLQVSPPPAQGESVRTVGVQTSEVLTGLTNGVKYTVRVQALNRSEAGASDATESNAESPARATSAVNRPNAVRNSTPLGGTATVTWAAPTDDGGDATRTYRVVAFQAGTDTEAKRLEVPGSQTTAVLDGFDTAGEFDFRVVSVNKAGDADPSPRSAVVQPGGRPDAVAAVQAVASVAGSNVGLDGRVRLEFAAPASKDKGGIAQYEVRVDSTVRTFGSTLPIVVTGLGNGTRYTFDVRGCNALGECADQWSPTAAETPYGPVRQPNIGTGRPSAKQVSFSWSPPAPNGRDITRAELSVNGGGWSPVGLSGTNVQGNDYGQTFSFRIRMFDAAGQVSPENGASVGTDGLVVDRRAVDDAFLGGTWGRNGNNYGGTWGTAGSAPAGAVSWYTNGSVLGIKCMAPGAGYTVVFAGGRTETWSWWAQLDVGTWVRSAAIYPVNGSNGIRGC